MKRLTGFSKGQIFVLYAVAMTALLGAIALSTDVGVMYYNWASMQRAVDAAALAGANYLPEDTSNATAQATNYSTINGLAPAEIATSFNSPTNDTITVTASRTVPYYLGKVVGLTDQVVQVSASAQISGGISCLNCVSLGPTSQPPLGSGTVITPCVTCGWDSTGSAPASAPSSPTEHCQLIPIGLDKSVLYQGRGTSVVLQQGRISPGNWDFLELGGPGGNVLRNNIASGYQGPIAAGQYIWTKTGQNVGPANQGFDDRIGATSGGTWQSHDESDPRVIVMPVVDWTTVGNGSSTVEVLGFAHMYLESSLGHGQFQAYYIDDLVPDSLVSATPPPAGFRGARGNPVLTR
ncbi:MAG: pilus assembly protein TadG-related protein [Candidatus Binatus sp.]|uniref:pilus assembly protein TadG-related protein n=1 Tax=Candidatus Binatus sp. TaxID=2811406 RepID=UPI00271794B0|nr:pilus assembly protein TadG-related protein [Candidatus Binatus sp.]MDO8433444.1 pilus assembly protein TadG-related protein [Candidatus Binatus sp.]